LKKNGDVQRNFQVTSASKKLKNGGRKKSITVLPVKEKKKKGTKRKGHGGGNKAKTTPRQTVKGTGLGNNFGLIQTKQTRGDISWGVGKKKLYTVSGE